MPEVPVWRLAIEISGEAPSDMAIATIQAKIAAQGLPAAKIAAQKST